MHTLQILGHSQQSLCSLMHRYRANARVTGFIYLRSIQEPRVLRCETALMSMFKDLCGEDTLDHVFLATNRWYPEPEDEKETTERAIVSDIRRFGSSGEKRVRVHRLKNTYSKADVLPMLQVFQNLNPVTLLVQNEVAVEKKTYSKTTAGARIQLNLIEQVNQMKGVSS
jgi:hypothetical protein